MNGIKVRLTTTMALICVIPLAIALTVSFLSSSATARQSAEDLNLKMAEYVENDFIKTLDANMRAIEILAAAPSTREYFANPEKYQDEMVRHTQIVDEKLADGNSTVVTGPDGMQLARSKGNLVDISTREYFQKAISGTTYVSDVSISKTTGARIIVPAVPIYDESESKVIGIVSRNYDVNYLHEHLLSEAGANQMIFILDRDGNVVATTTQEMTAEDSISMTDNECYKAALAGATEDSFVEVINGQKCVTSFVKEPLTSWVIIVASDYKSVTAASTRSAIIVILIGLVMAFAAIVIAVIFSDSMDKPIAEINQSLSLLAAGQFKSIEKFTSRKDEFGSMIKHTNALIEKLRDIVSDIKASALDVNSSSVELAETADQISRTADDVSEAVQEIASGATQQADEIQHAIENIQIISTNVDDVTQCTKELQHTTASMDSGSKSSQKELMELQKSSEEMGKSIDRITETVSATNASVDNISLKVEVIDSIASQTSLLALNASIEAARAGEAGRGFAVVAEEIGKLADSSAESASEIRHEMEILRGDAQSAVEIADIVSRSTKEQQKTLENTVKSIQLLIDGIRTTISGVEDISGQAKACNDSKTVVVDSMNSLSAISEENAAASQETSASMQELNATVNTLAASAGSLKDISESLMKEIEFFQE